MLSPISLSKACQLYWNSFQCFCQKKKNQNIINQLTFSRIFPKLCNHFENQCFVQFINNRYRILTTVKRWEPTVKRGLAPADLRSIRAMFNRDTRADVVKVLVLVVDQPPQDIDGLVTESQLLQDDDVFVLM